MNILAIETSCDETAIAMIKVSKGDTFEVLSNKTISSANLQAEYGGVFPTLAKREHAKAITQLLAESLRQADLVEFKDENKEDKELDKAIKYFEKEPDIIEPIKLLLSEIKKPDIDLIAVTHGPGLEPALWVGVNFARAISSYWGIKIMGVNHMEGHIMSSLIKKVDSFRYKIEDIQLPALALLISGGHTELVRFSKWGEYNVIGETRDDAVGEAYDKVARMIGLKYPGGPEISKYAERARTDNIIVDDNMRLPRPMINSDDYDFSFSGLKTSVLYMLKKFPDINEDTRLKVSMEFENAVTDVLYSKVKKAIFETNAKSLIVGGGVSANKNIRSRLNELAHAENVELYLPDAKNSTDNALMIAVTAMIKHEEIKKFPKPDQIVANGNLRLD